MSKQCQELKTTYNGWKNRDTWLVSLWMSNDENNYNYFKDNKKYFLSLNGDNFKREVKNNLYITDSLNWRNVSITEIKETIKEF